VKITSLGPRFDKRARARGRGEDHHPRSKKNLRGKGRCGLASKDKTLELIKKQIHDQAASHPYISKMKPSGEKIQLRVGEIQSDSAVLGARKRKHQNGGE